MRSLPHYPYLTRRIIHLFESGALSRVASVDVEPAYGYVVRINYADGGHRVTYGNDLGVNAAAAAELAKDKGHSKFLLRAVGVEVPEGTEFLLPSWAARVRESPRQTPMMRSGTPVKPAPTSNEQSVTEFAHTPADALLLGQEHEVRHPPRCRRIANSNLGRIALDLASGPAMTLTRMPSNLNRLPTSSAIGGQENTRPCGRASSLPKSMGCESTISGGLADADLPRARGRSGDRQHPWRSAAVHVEVLYDPARNVTKIRSTGLNADLQVNTYNQPKGTLATRKDGNNHVTSYGYDPAGNLTTVTPPAPLGQAKYTYDSLSRVTSVTDGNGVRIDYAYDKLDRVGASAITCRLWSVCPTTGSGT